MTIRAHLDDASLLWRHGRREGALLNALLAVARISRERHPELDRQPGGQALEAFLRELTPATGPVRYRGVDCSVEHIFRRWLQCASSLETGLPVDLVVDSELPPGLGIRAGQSPRDPVRVSADWFPHLIASVMTAPENHAPEQTWAERVSSRRGNSATSPLPDIHKVR